MSTNHLRNRKRKSKPSGNSNITNSKTPVIQRDIVNDFGETKKIQVTSASSEELAVSRTRMKQQSYPALRMVGGNILEESKRALRYPQAYDTYNKMMLDDAVSLGYNAKRSFLWIALEKFKIKEGKAKNAASKEAAALIEYLFDNVEQSWYDIFSNISTFPKYGFSLMEMVFSQIKSGEYAGYTKLKRLAPINSRSIENWVFTDDQRRLLGIEQTTSFMNSADTNLNFGALGFKTNREVETEIPIKYNKLLHWAYNSESGNPLGESQFKHCYTTWLEKVMIQEYECVGISKDLGGLITIGVPSEVLNKAAIDPESKEADFVEQLMTDAANINANEQAYVMLPSDRDDGNNPLYSLELKGIQGSGKQFSLDETISRKRKAILDIFGVGFIDLGSNGGGSYALAEAGTSFHGLLLESDLRFIEEPFNNKLIPTLLALNGIKLSADEVPVFTAGEVDQKNPDVVSKVIQRTFAVNGIPRSKGIILKFVEDLGLPTHDLEDLTEEELWEKMGWNPETNEMQSRSSDGMKSGMNNGTGDSNKGRDNSTSNNENSMESKSDWEVKQKLNNGCFLLSNGTKSVEVLAEDVASWMLGEYE